MDIAKKIRMALVHLGITEGELARRLGTSPQAFSQRMKTNRWKPEDLEQISAALGGKIVVEIRFPDGTII